MSTKSRVDIGAQPIGGALSLYRLLDPKSWRDPYPLYHRLRVEAPVHWDPYLFSWVVTLFGCSDRPSYSAERTPSPEQLTQMGLESFNPVAQVMVKQMLFLDGEAHQRLRGLAAYAFTPGRVAVLRGHIEKLSTG